jgi:NAD(P)-dependent dehydrogenase (short-subunit alcohol dehydrogenase family)
MGTPTDLQQADPERNGLRSSGSRPVAVVTGASRGLGFLIARELARLGHDLVICARSAPGLQAAEAELAGFGVDVLAIGADVGVALDAQRVVAETSSRFGRLDVLVLNAGIIQVGPAQEMTTEDFAAAMDTMFWGAVHISSAAMPMLRQQRGRLLAVTSVGGKLPAPHLLPYTAAKHAAVGYAEGLRVEAIRDGVSVTVGVPGLMRTGSPRNALFTGDRVAENRWFTAVGNLPLLSMDAERAARRLVRATMWRRPEVILTPLAKLGVRAHAVAPSTSLRVVSLVNRLLPGPASSAGRPLPGHLLAEKARSLGWLSRRDDAAAAAAHELDDPVPGTPA